MTVSATSLLTQPQRFCLINKHLLILKQWIVQGECEGHAGLQEKQHESERESQKLSVDVKTATDQQMTHLNSLARITCQTEP